MGIQDFLTITRQYEMTGGVRITNSQYYVSTTDILLDQGIRGCCYIANIGNIISLKVYRCNSYCVGLRDVISDILGINSSQLLKEYFLILQNWGMYY